MLGESILRFVSVVEDGAQSLILPSARVVAARSEGVTAVNRRGKLRQWLISLIGIFILVSFQSPLNFSGPSMTISD